MTVRFAMPLVVAVMIGCTPTELLRPSFPAVPPEGAAKAKPDAEVKAETAKARAPVTPSQVTEKSAHEIAKALEAELLSDAAAPAPKP